MRCQIYSVFCFVKYMSLLSCTGSLLAENCSLIPTYRRKQTKGKPTDTAICACMGKTQKNMSACSVKFNSLTHTVRFLINCASVAELKKIKLFLQAAFDDNTMLNLET